MQRAACRRCAGDCDPFSCRLVGLGPLFRARVDSPCAWERCVHLPDNRRFNIHGPLHEHSLIIGLGDMGYLHTECASAMLKPYENEASMDELTARVDDMSRGLPIDIAQARGRTRGALLVLARVCPPALTRHLARAHVSCCSSRAQAFRQIALAQPKFRYLIVNGFGQRRQRPQNRSVCALGLCESSCETVRVRLPAAQSAAMLLLLCCMCLCPVLCAQW